MISFLLKRPIGVLMTFAALLIVSVLSLVHLPVSLLPDIDMPKIVIKINYPNGSPQEIEANILAPIRENFASLNQLKAIESEAYSESGIINIFYEYGTDMKLSIIEANEKMDLLMDLMPDQMERPRVVRINLSDIPVARIQVVPHNPRLMMDASLLVEKVLKKRMESLKGVSIVDLNGVKKRAIIVTPNIDKLRAANLDIRKLTEVVSTHNLQMGSITIRNGHYRYFLKIENEATSTPESIRKIPINTTSEKVITLGQVADIAWGEVHESAYHLFGKREGIVLEVHKQFSAQMNILMPLIYESVNQYRLDFPEMDFYITQDQSVLLDAGINNLSTSLLYGSLFAFGVLFLFAGHFRIPLIIGISIPSSLFLSFLFFYVFDISLNIISLSGLALGLGMLIDTAIIVLDNITQNLNSKNQRINYSAVFNACVSGVTEVVSPLLSAVLTTLAIFIPLIFLNGLAGALFYDQAIAVAATLLASLLVSFFLLPLLYLVFYVGKGRMEKSNLEKNLFKDSLFFTWLLAWYEQALIWSFNRKKRTYTFCLILLLSGWGVLTQIEVSGLPEIEKTDFLLKIDWNTPIAAKQNKKRVLTLLEAAPTHSLISESDIGNQQFLSGSAKNKVSEAMVYFKLQNAADFLMLKKWLVFYLQSSYPAAQYQFLDAANGFNELFVSSNHYFEVKFKNRDSQEPLPAKKIKAALTTFPSIKFRNGKGIDMETRVVIRLNIEKMARHHINHQKIISLLTQLFSEKTITEVKNFGEVLPVKLSMPSMDFEAKINSALIDVIREEQSISLPLRRFISYHYETDFKSIVADRSGIFQSILWDKQEDYQAIIQDLRKREHNQELFSLSFAGEYFQSKENLQQLYYILLISLLLLYFILSAQFESLIQPIIVILTLPLGMSGSLIVLWLFGGSLNIMSGIGIIIMLGIMVNDAILKIDTMNRLLYHQNKIDRNAIRAAIFQAGNLRFKPILMTSLTTILALLPVLFSAGLGSDLQSPLILTVIGGLTIGTVTSLFFVPIAFFYSKIILLK